MENGESAMEASLKGCQRNRLHGDFADGVVDRRVHPAAVHVRTCGAHVPRIRADLDDRGRDLGDRIADLDADDVCSRLLKHAGEEFVVPGLATISHGIDRMVEFYHRTLLWVLERQRATMMVTFATIAATLILYVVAPKGFLPLQDTASITAVTEAGCRRFLCGNAKPPDPGRQRDQG